MLLIASRFRYPLFVIRGCERGHGIRCDDFVGCLFNFRRLHLYKVLPTING